MARPSQYTKDVLEKARRYIEGHEDFGDPVPTIAGLACVLGITRETCYAWARDEKKVAFSDILKTLMQKQERELVKHGLLGAFNPTLTKMLLTKHGYSDRVEADHTSSDGSMTPKALDLSGLPTEVLEAIVKAADGQADD